MFRYRYTVQVKDGHLKEFWEICKKLNEVNRARGRSEFTFWAPPGGVSNEVVAEVDYPDRATHEQEFDAFHSDEEALDLDKKLQELIVEGSARDELFEAFTP
jgi:hypothetical protein